DDSALVGALGAAVVGMEVLDQGGPGGAERGGPVLRDAGGGAGVGQDVAERDAVFGHRGQHGGERGAGVVPGGGGEEKVARSPQSAASARPASLNPCGMPASSGPSQAACSAGDGSPSGW